MSKNLKVEIIGYDSGWGGQDFGCEDGPEQAQINQIQHKLRHLDVEGKWRGALGIQFLGKHDDIIDQEQSLPLLVEGLKRLFNHVKHALEQQYTPIVIGGDHSSAMATWAGVASTMEKNKKLGLIWISAHMSAHTAETAEDSRKWKEWWHGQPIATLLGEGTKELKKINHKKQTILPDNLTLIGVRNFDTAEKSFLRQHKVKVYDIDDVKEAGFDKVLKKAIERATDGTDGFGISIALDAFDPKDAPAVSNPERDGLKIKSVLPTLKSIGHHSMFKALEFAEFNPHNDIENKTTLLMANIIKSVFTPNKDKNNES